MTKQAHIALTPNQVSERVIVCGEPARVNRIAALLDNPVELEDNREFRSMAGQYQGKTITICSTGVGAPSAIIAIEELALCGAQYVVRVGSAGALQEDIGLGELIIAEGAVRDEGGSHAYVSGHYPAFADRNLVSGLDDYLSQVGHKSHYGVVRSHDSFYRDDEEAICAKWHDKGVLGADMETSALYTIGRLRGVKLASVLNNVVLYQQDVQEGVNQYVDSEDVMMQGELTAAKAAIHALWSQE